MLLCRLFGLEEMRMADPGETREKIMQVARSHFARKGFHGTSMDSIVKGTSLSKGALYWHFRSKGELFAAVLKKEVESIIQDYVEAPSEAEKDANAFVTLRGERIIDMLWGDPEMRLLFFTLFIERLRGGEEGRELSDIAGDLLASIQEKLWPVAREAISAFRDSETRDLYDKVLMTLRFLMHGIIMEMGFRLDLDSAKECWRFAMSHFDFKSEG